MEKEEKSQQEATVSPVEAEEEQEVWESWIHQEET